MGMQDQPNPSTAYDILGVSPNGRPALIKAAFRKLAERYHPIAFLQPTQLHDVLSTQAMAIGAVEVADFWRQDPSGHLFAGWATPTLESSVEWMKIVVRWNEIQRAYHVLSDDERRRAYDTSGAVIDAEFVDAHYSHKGW